ncbi:MAG: PQQ-like beta-propeller repeat protein [Myxococcales bacterium]|nr:PQQ-like beta-propeller repeat protein [Myxococcales bacterium]
MDGQTSRVRTNLLAQAAVLAVLLALATAVACGQHNAGPASAPAPPPPDQLIDYATPHWPMFRHDQLRGGRSPQYRVGAPGLAWTYDFGAEVMASPVIDADGTIYVGAFDGALYAIDKNGKLRWRFETFAAIWSTPAIALDGTVYVASIDKNVYAVRDGQLVWNVKLGNCAFSSPLLDRAGNLYIGSNDARVHSIAPDGSLRWSTRVGAPVDASVALSPWGSSSSAPPAHV